ncbi:RNI-like protein [Ramaria rubella]|nr:RNI-like protein [Ramaria rubella]
MQYSNFNSRSTLSHRKAASPLLTNNYIDKHDAGLTGVQGAEAIVKLLRTHRSVHHLVLGHNRLGDAGCVALFDHLRSEEGKKHQIVEISLNANRIGDAGLWAISRYLEDNESLGALFLQNNLLKGDRPIMLRFALAINRSNLHTLSLTCNKSLGEIISTTFLPNLSAPKLAELHLSVCSLGPAATPSLISYLASPRAWGMRTVKLNGNPLGLSSVSRIIRALERANWSIGWVEMHACCLQDGILEGNDGWKKCEEQLRIKVLERNRYLGKKTAEDALILLPYARPTLLAYGRPCSGSRPRLPPELAIHILSFLAPSLSPAQHLRVCSYAASPDTLPVAGLTFPSLQPSLLSIPSPWSTSWSRFAPRHTCMGDAPGTASPGAFLCPACARMRRIMSPVRDEERKAWLKKVGCDRFEPEFQTGMEEILELDHHGGSENPKGKDGENFNV